MIRASRLRRTVLFAVAHGARKRSPPIRVKPLSQGPHRRHEVSATVGDDVLHSRLVAGYGHGAWRRRGLSLSDVSLCTRHSGVKDCAAPPIFRRSPFGPSTENRFLRLPPLAVAFRDP